MQIIQNDNAMAESNCWLSPWTSSSTGPSPWAEVYSSFGSRPMEDPNNFPVSPNSRHPMKWNAALKFLIYVEYYGYELALHAEDIELQAVIKLAS